MISSMPFCGHIEARWRLVVMLVVSIVGLLMLPALVHAACNNASKQSATAVRKACQAQGGREAMRCNPALKASVRHLRLALQTLSCSHSRPAVPPKWICNSVENFLSEKARCQCAGGSGYRKGATRKANPYAETVFQRQGLRLPLNAAQRKAFVAATVSQDATVVLKMVKQLRRQATNPLVRYAATLMGAYELLKINADANMREIDRLVGLLHAERSDIPPALTADADFLSAILAEREGSPEKALRHLQAALEREPGFFNAAVMALRLQITRIARHSSRSRVQCMRAYRDLISYLEAMLRLHPCPRMAVHAEIYLRRHIQQPKKLAPLAAAQVYLSAIAWDIPRARKALVRFQRLAKNETCVADMVHDLRRFTELASMQLQAER